MGSVLHKDPSKGECVDKLSLGVMARSRKENERRLAIHPLHVGRIAADLRERVYLERGYGERFGVPDVIEMQSEAGAAGTLHRRARRGADALRGRLAAQPRAAGDGAARRAVTVRELYSKASRLTGGLPAAYPYARWRIRSGAAIL